MPPDPPIQSMPLEQSMQMIHQLALQKQNLSTKIGPAGPVLVSKIGPARSFLPRPIFVTGQQCSYSKIDAVSLETTQSILNRCLEIE